MKDNISISRNILIRAGVDDYNADNPNTNYDNFERNDEYDDYDDYDDDFESNDDDDDDNFESNNDDQPIGELGCTVSCSQDPPGKWSK